MARPARSTGSDPVLPRDRATAVYSLASYLVDQRREPGRISSATSLSVGREAPVHTTLMSVSSSGLRASTCHGPGWQRKSAPGVEPLKLRM